MVAKAMDLMDLTSHKDVIVFNRDASRILGRWLPGYFKVLFVSKISRFVPEDYHLSMSKAFFATNLSMQATYTFHQKG